MLLLIHCIEQSQLTEARSTAYLKNPALGGCIRSTVLQYTPRHARSQPCCHGTATQLLCLCTSTQGFQVGCCAYQQCPATRAVSLIQDLACLNMLHCAQSLCTADSCRGSQKDRQIIALLQIRVTQACTNSQTDNFRPVSSQPVSSQTVYSNNT